MTQQSTRVSGVEREILPGEVAGHLRRDALENRERILTAANRLFAEFGVETVSMHRVAQAAGVGQATMYRHYLHKGDLCRDVMSDSAGRATSELETYLRDTEGHAALDRLDTVLLRMVSFVEEKLPYIAAIGESCSGEDRTLKFSLPAYRYMHGIISTLLTEGQREGTVKSVDITFVTDAIMATLSADMYQFQREERGLTREQIVQRVRSLYT